MSSEATKAPEQCTGCGATVTVGRDLNLRDASGGKYCPKNRLGHMLSAAVELPPVAIRPETLQNLNNPGITKEEVQNFYATIPVAIKPEQPDCAGCGQPLIEGHAELFEPKTGKRYHARCESYTKIEAVKPEAPQAKFIQLCSNAGNTGEHPWGLFALDEQGNVWCYEMLRDKGKAIGMGWEMLSMERKPMEVKG